MDLEGDYLSSVFKYAAAFNGKPQIEKYVKMSTGNFLLHNWFHYKPADLFRVQL